jgi:hypothetical protein
MAPTDPRSGQDDTGCYYYDTPSGDVLAPPGAAPGRDCRARRGWRPRLAFRRRRWLTCRREGAIRLTSELVINALIYGSGAGYQVLPVIDTAELLSWWPSSFLGWPPDALTGTDLPARRTVLSRSRSPSRLTANRNRVRRAVYWLRAAAGPLRR